MNIQNISNINKVNSEENKSLEKRPYLAPQEPDTFESSQSQKTEVKKDSILDKIAKMYSKMKPLKLDDKSFTLMAEDNLDSDKVLAMAKDMTTSKTKSVSLKRAACDGKNFYVMQTNNKDKSKNVRLLDKDLNVLEQESTKINFDEKGHPTSKTVLTTDFRTNTFCETKFDFTKEGYPQMVSATKIRRDQHDRLIRKETYEKSDIDGMFNVKYEFPNGKTRQISKTTRDEKTGHILVEKDMRSTDMTRTQFRYEDDPNGNRIVDYKITSTDGKVLMNQSQTFEVLGDNKFRSSRNDKSYLIALDSESNTLSVTDEKKNVTSEIKLKDFVEGDDKKIANMLKMIPGDELLNLKNNVIKINEIDERLKSYCKTEMDFGLDSDNIDFDAPVLMYSSLAISDDPFVFLHELGHATDVGGKEFCMKQDESGQLAVVVDGSIQDDKKFCEIYSKERENFLKEFPVNEREHIDYFIADEAIPGRPKCGKIETIAETNALINTYQTVGLLGIRTQYLQQHFPKTIAYLSEQLVPTEEQNN